MHKDKRLVSFGIQLPPNRLAINSIITYKGIDILTSEEDPSEEVPVSDAGEIGDWDTISVKVKSTAKAPDIE